MCWEAVSHPVSRKMPYIHIHAMSVAVASDQHAMPDTHDRVCVASATQPVLNISQHTYHHNKDNIAQHRVLGSVLGSGLAPSFTEDARHTYICDSQGCRVRILCDVRQVGTTNPTLTTETEKQHTHTRTHTTLTDRYRHRTRTVPHWTTGRNSAGSVM